MRRLAASCCASLLVLGLAACDKANKEPDKAATKKTADEADAKPDDAKQPKVEDEPEPDDAKAPDAAVDDTKGLGGVARELAKDTKAPTPAGAKHYDTSKDAGGLIGHVATALAHDEDLEGAATTKELLKLAGEDVGEKAASDGDVCKHVWAAIVSKSYPDLEGREDEFTGACKAEIEKQRVKLGVEIFTQHAECVLAAGDLAALDDCDAAEQEAEDFLHANPHGDQPEESLCISAVEHMFILINRDIGTDADMLEALQEDVFTIKDDAILACRDEGTKAELTCIMKAGELAALESC